MKSMLFTEWVEQADVFGNSFWTPRNKFVVEEEDDVKSITLEDGDTVVGILYQNGDALFVPINEVRFLKSGPKS